MNGERRTRLLFLRSLLRCRNARQFAPQGSRERRGQDRRRGAVSPPFRLLVGESG